MVFDMFDGTKLYMSTCCAIIQFCVEFSCTFYLFSAHRVCVLGVHQGVHFFGMKRF